MKKAVFLLCSVVWLGLVGYLCAAPCNCQNSTNVVATPSISIPSTFVSHTPIQTVSTSLPTTFSSSQILSRPVVVSRPTIVSSSTSLPIRIGEPVGEIFPFYSQPTWTTSNSNTISTFVSSPTTIVSNPSSVVVERRVVSWPSTAQVPEPVEVSTVRISRPTDAPEPIKQTFVSNEPSTETTSMPVQAEWLPSLPPIADSVSPAIEPEKTIVAKSNNNGSNADKEMETGMADNHLRHHDLRTEPEQASPVLAIVPNNANRPQTVNSKSPLDIADKLRAAFQTRKPKKAELEAQSDLASLAKASQEPELPNAELVQLEHQTQEPSEELAAVPVLPGHLMTDDDPMPLPTRKMDRITVSRPNTMPELPRSAPQNVVATTNRTADMTAKSNAVTKTTPPVSSLVLGQSTAPTSSLALKEVLEKPPLPQGLTDRSLIPPVLVQDQESKDEDDLLAALTAPATSSPDKRPPHRESKDRIPAMSGESTTNGTLLVATIMSVILLVFMIVIAVDYYQRWLQAQTMVNSRFGLPDDDDSNLGVLDGTSSLSPGYFGTESSFTSSYGLGAPFRY